MGENGTALPPMITIGEALAMQAPRGWEFFICSKCYHWGGGCTCRRGVFIGCTGADTSRCLWFESVGQLTCGCGGAMRPAPGLIANEETEALRCERCGTVVYRKARP